MRLLIRLAFWRRWCSVWLGLVWTKLPRNPRAACTLVPGGPKDSTVQAMQAESKVVIFRPVLRIQFSSSVLCLMQGPRTGVAFLLAALHDVKSKIACARKRRTHASLDDASQRKLFPARYALCL